MTRNMTFENTSTTNTETPAVSAITPAPERPHIPQCTSQSATDGDARSLKELGGAKLDDAIPRDKSPSEISSALKKVESPRKSFTVGSPVNSVPLNETPNFSKDQISMRPQLGLSGATVGNSGEMQNIERPSPQIGDSLPLKRELDSLAVTELVAPVKRPRTEEISTLTPSVLNSQDPNHALPKSSAFSSSPDIFKDTEMCIAHQGSATNDEGSRRFSVPAPRADSLTRNSSSVSQLIDSSGVNISQALIDKLTAAIGKNAGHTKEGKSLTPSQPWHSQTDESNEGGFPHAIPHDANMNLLQESRESIQRTDPLSNHEFTGAGSKDKAEATKDTSHSINDTAGTLRGSDMEPCTASSENLVLLPVTDSAVSGNGPISPMERGDHVAQLQSQNDDKREHVSTLHDNVESAQKDGNLDDCVLHPRATESYPRVRQPVTGDTLRANEAESRNQELIWSGSAQERSKNCAGSTHSDVKRDDESLEAPEQVDDSALETAVNQTFANSLKLPIQRSELMLMSDVDTAHAEAHNISGLPQESHVAFHSTVGETCVNTTTGNSFNTESNLYRTEAGSGPIAADPTANSKEVSLLTDPGRVNHAVGYDVVCAASGSLLDNETEAGPNSFSAGNKPEISNSELGGNMTESSKGVVSNSLPVDLDETDQNLTNTDASDVDISFNDGDTGKQNDSISNSPFEPLTENRDGREGEAKIALPSSGCPNGSALGLRSAPVDTASEEASMERDQLACDEQAAAAVPKKRVQWVPDDKLVEVHYIDTRVQLIKNWDPEFEITLPFAPSTLAQLRAQGAADDGGSEFGRKSAPSSVAGGLGIRSAPAPNDFELARRKEREMELEKSRQAKLELQSRLDMMVPETEWRDPVSIILPSECRETTDSSDALKDDGEVNEISGVVEEYDVCRSLQLPWLDQQGTESEECAPGSPPSDIDLDTDYITVNIPTRDISSDEAVDSMLLHESTERNSEGDFGSPYSTVSDSEAEMRLQAELSGHMASQQRQSKDGKYHGRGNNGDHDAFSASGRDQGEFVNINMSPKNTVQPPTSRSPVLPKKSNDTPVSLLASGIPVAAPNAHRNFSLGRTSGPLGLMPQTGMVPLEHGMPPIPPLALQQLLAQLQENAAANMSMAPNYQLPGAMMPPMPIPGMGVGPPQMMGMHPNRPMGLQPPHLHQHPSQHPHLSKAQGQHQLHSDGSHRGRSRKLCRYFNTPQGCRDGPNCSFLHVPDRAGKNAKSSNSW